MTTGSWTTGPWTPEAKIHAAKSWGGGDGMIIPTRYSSYKQWNPYVMAHAKFHSSNPNKVGIVDTTAGVDVVRENHSFYNGYGPISGDGNISPVFPTGGFNFYWTSREEMALLAKLLKKVKGHDIDIGVSLAEVDKLANTVAGTLKNLVYGLNDLRKLRFAQFARRFGARPPRKDRVEKLRTSDIPARFLEMRYAWEPTIKDVYEAAKAFEELSNGPRQTYQRASKRKRYEDTYDTNYCRPARVIEVRRSYLFEYYEEMEFARQLGLANPASILWERLPWSFVIDWFIPIGNYLNLIGQVPFMKGRWCRTSSVRVSCSGSFPAVKAVGGYDPASPYPDCEWERFWLERSISETPPAVPAPTFRVAGAVAGKRVENAIALAYQVASKIVGGRDGLDDYTPDVTLTE